MTCPDGYQMTQNRLDQPPTVTTPGDVVWVRVGDRLYIDGEQPQTPSPRFWRVCTPDTPPTTTEPPTTTTQPAMTTTTTHLDPTTTTTATTEPPRGPVHCEGPGWFYDGSDPAVCATTTLPPASPPQRGELADTGGGFGLVGLGLFLVAAGAVVVWAATRRREQETPMIR